MLNTLNSYKIVLGSASPRRRELLAGLDIPFTVRTIPNIDESWPPTLTKEEIPLFISKQKAKAYQPLLADDELLVTADTIVWCRNRMFGKPHGHDDAIDMLHQLSGQTHQVATGVCLLTTAKHTAFTAVSDVTFAPLSDEEIRYYVDKYQPYDKAGSYGIQEWIGFIGIESIRGSFYNVMGLPIQRLYRELIDFTAV